MMWDSPEELELPRISSGRFLYHKQNSCREQIYIDSDRFCGDMEVMITVSSGTGRLMNWGSCIGEDAAPGDAPAVMIGSETFPAVTEPVLIEEDVVYARAGMQCIVYLKNDGSVWWQGRYEGTFHSGIVEQPSWARGWDAEDLSGCVLKVRRSCWTTAFM